METKTLTARTIFVCRCGKTWSYEYQRLLEQRSKFDPMSGTNRHFWRELGMWRINKEGARIQRSQDGWQKCSCGRLPKAHDVVGKRSDHKCGARCTHAKGGDCECSCGGLNHGKGWSADEEATLPTGT